MFEEAKVQGLQICVWFVVRLPELLLLLFSLWKFEISLYFCSGVKAAQRNVILVDILGVDKLSSSFAMLLAFQGVGTLIGPPLAGKVFLFIHSSINPSALGSTHLLSIGLVKPAFQSIPYHILLRLPMFHTIRDLTCHMRDTRVKLTTRWDCARCKVKP